MSFYICIECESKDSWFRSLLHWVCTCVIQCYKNRERKKKNWQTFSKICLHVKSHRNLTAIYDNDVISKLMDMRKKEQSTTQLPGNFHFITCISLNILMFMIIRLWKFDFQWLLHCSKLQLQRAKVSIFVWIIIAYCWSLVSKCTNCHSVVCCWNSK